MAKHDVLPSLFNNPVVKKDPFLFDQEPELTLTKSEFTCLTNVDLNALENLDIFVDLCFENNLFENSYLIDQEIVSVEQDREDLFSAIKTEPMTEDEVETDSGRGSFSEAEIETEEELKKMEVKEEDETEEDEAEEEYDEEEEGDESEEEEDEAAEQELFFSLLNRFAADKKIDERTRKRAISDFSSVDAAFVLSCHPADIWKLNCEVGLEFRNYLKRSYPEGCVKSSKPSATPRRPVPAKRQSCRRRKVYIHTFCLDLLLHPKKFGSVVEWIDTKSLTFRVLNTHQVAHLWCLVKGNSLEDYETFGRGVRFSMARGFFARMRPQKKKTYRLTEKALRNYNTYRPGIVPSFRR